MKTLKNNFWPLFSFVLLVVLFFWKVVIKGLIPLPADILVAGYLPWREYFITPIKNPIVSDAISFIFPMRILGIDLIKSGQWPLWNPHILSGAPLLANFQSAPFSPTNIFYFLFDHLTAWSLQVIIQHFLAALFLYILLRHWKASKFASVVGGAAFAFSGFVLIWSQWNAHSLATALVPLTVLFADKLLVEKKYASGAGLSVAIFLQMVSGYPQIVFYTLMAVGALWLVRDKRSTLWLMMFLAIGFGLAAFQILPAYELVGLSQRNTEPIPLNWVFLYPKEVITFLAPDYFGNHATNNYWGAKNYLGTVGFIGLVPFVLALVGLTGSKRQEVKFLWLTIIAALILAFKTPISLFLWRKNILGLSAAVFYKSLAIFVAAVGVAVGFGVDTIKSSKKVNFKRILVIPWLILTGWTLHAVRIQSEVALNNLILPITILFVTTILLLIKPRIKIYLLGLILVLELFVFGWKFTPFTKREYVYPNLPVFEFLQEQEKPFRVSGGNVMPLNLNIPYKLEFIGGYDAVYPYVMAKFLGVTNGNSADATQQDRFGALTNFDSQLTNLMNMKYLLWEKDVPFDDKRYKVVFEDKSVLVLENKEVLPRQFEVTSWEVVEDEKETFEKLLDPDFPLGQRIILAEAPPVGTEKMLFVSDTFYPGWQADVDGQETKIYQADFAYRAIAVPEGEYEVEFKYQPKSFKNGLKISVVSAAILISVFLAKKKLQVIL